jgi:uncharacterized protein YkwD
VLGENLGFAADVLTVHHYLMLSPTHRATILEPRFNTVGICVGRRTDGSILVVERFAKVKT